MTLHHFCTAVASALVDVVASNDIVPSIVAIDSVAGRLDCHCAAANIAIIVIVGR